MKKSLIIIMKPSFYIIAIEQYELQKVFLHFQQSSTIVKEV